jgi:hypothetical protein
MDFREEDLPFSVFAIAATVYEVCRIFAIRFAAGLPQGTARS